MAIAESCEGGKKGGCTAVANTHITPPILSQRTRRSELRNLL
jgi:hypothetical protein